MSELSRLESMAADVRTRLVPPDLEQLRRTARRRRTAVVAGSGLVAAAAIAAAVIGVNGVYGDQSAPVVPAHTTGTPHPTVPTRTADTPQRLTPEQIVKSPDAELEELAVSDEDRAVAASLWQLCLTHSCSRAAWAVAVTANDFQSASYAKVAQFADVEWVGGQAFAVDIRGGISLITTSGVLRTLEPTRRASPIVSGQTLLRDNQKAGRFYAVDPRDQTVHPIPRPPDVRDLDELGQQGETLLGLANGGTELVSSSDGGTTWNSPTRLPRVALTGLLDSGDPGLLATIEVGDDGTLLPGTLRRSTDGGASWQVVQPTRLRNVLATWACVTPSGRLLVGVQHESRSDRLATGVYQSTDSSWTSFVPMTTKGSMSRFGAADLLDSVADGHGNQALYVMHDKTYVSTDEGRTWQPTAVRVNQ